MSGLSSFFTSYIYNMVCAEENRFSVAIDGRFIYHSQDLELDLYVLQVLSALCESMEALDEPEAKASMIWILGEYVTEA